MTSLQRRKLRKVVAQKKKEVHKKASPAKK